MFSIWGITDFGTAYTPEAFRAHRQVEKIQRIRSVPKYGETGSLEESKHSHHPDFATKVRAYQKGEAKMTREPAILAKQIMKTPIVSLPLHAPLSQALDVFRQYRFRHIPVLSENKQLAGLLSDRDAWRELATNRLSPTAGHEFAQHHTIETVMSTPVLSAHPDTEIRVVARVLFEERIGAMPIVDDSKTLVGMLTRSDILRIVTNQVPFELWI